MVSEQQIRDVIASVKEDIDANTLPVDAAFSDSGFDSLDVASILLGLQEQYGLQIPEGMEDEIDSIQSILAFVERARG